MASFGSAQSVTDDSSVFIYCFESSSTSAEGYYERAAREAECEVPRADRSLPRDLPTLLNNAPVEELLDSARPPGTNTKQDGDGSNIETKTCDDPFCNVAEVGPEGLRNRKGGERPQQNHQDQKAAVNAAVESSHVDLGPWNYLRTECSTLEERIEAIWGATSDDHLRAAKEVVLQHCTRIRVAVVSYDAEAVLPSQNEYNTKRKHYFVLYSFRDGSTFFGAPPVDLKEWRELAVDGCETSSRQDFSGVDRFRTHAKRDVLFYAPNAEFSNSPVFHNMRRFYTVHNGVGLVLSAKKHLRRITESNPITGKLLPSAAVSGYQVGQATLQSPTQDEELGGSGYYIFPAHCTFDVACSRDAAAVGSISPESSSVHNYNFLFKKTQAEVGDEGHCQVRLFGRIDQTCLVCCDRDDRVGYVAARTPTDWSEESTLAFIRATIENFASAQTGCTV